MPGQLIVIPGKPIAKKRPRFARRGNFVTTYSDQETEEGRTLWEIKQHWEINPIGNPMKVFCLFVLPIPASTSKKRTEEMLNGMIRHIKRPDTDNYLKFYMDCMNQVVFLDDSQVWDLRGQKVYGTEPKTVIELEWE